MANIRNNFWNNINSPSTKSYSGKTNLLVTKKDSHKYHRFVITSCIFISKIVRNIEVYSSMLWSHWSSTNCTVSCAHARGGDVIRVQWGRHIAYQRRHIHFISTFHATKHFITIETYLFQCLGLVSNIYRLVIYSFTFLEIEIYPNVRILNQFCCELRWY